MSSRSARTSGPRWRVGEQPEDGLLEGEPCTLLAQPRQQLGGNLLGNRPAEPFRWPAVRSHELNRKTFERRVRRAHDASCQLRIPEMHHRVGCVEQRGWHVPALAETLLDLQGNLEPLQRVAPVALVGGDLT